MNQKYALFPADILSDAKTVIAHSIDFEGGTLRLSGGALIDGRLTRTTIISVDGSPTKISALANLDSCILNCKDIIIDGEFSGEINATGDVELGDTCRIQGTITHAGRVMTGALADTDAMKLKRFPQPKAQMRSAYFDTIDEAKPVPLLASVA